MNIYIIHDSKVGFEVLYSENDNITCKEFKDLCNAIAKVSGDDIYIIKDELIKRGFKVAKNKCVYNMNEI